MAKRRRRRNPEDEEEASPKPKLDLKQTVVSALVGGVVGTFAAVKTTEWMRKKDREEDERRREEMARLERILSAAEARAPLPEAQGPTVQTPSHSLDEILFGEEE